MDQPPKSLGIDYVDHESHAYSFLPDPVVDALVQVVLELGSESWVTRRRLLALEAVLEAQGVATQEAVETYVPPPEVEQAWREERDLMMRTVYGAFARRPGGAREAVERMKSGATPLHPPLNAAAPSERARGRGASGV